MVTGMLKAIGIGAAAAVVGVFVAIVGIIAIFLFAIVGAFMGAVTGFILQYVPVLGPLVVKGFATIGVQNPDLVALGAMLGFIGGFFKNHEQQWREWRQPPANNW
ncbi:Uncharacterised protein [Candidatus Gugararchaeum adminiculabundum]|nr:Uncharacterised protein [Candidatus Gugararchaeum adminiculabundum]